MLPAAWAAPTYPATAAEETPGSTQCACGVLAIASSSALGGFALCAAAMAGDVGSTKKECPANGLAASTRRTFGRGPVCIGAGARVTPTTVRTGTAHRASTPTAEDIT